MRFYRALIACFFFSGATALIYEVVWVRLLALVFGNTVHAVGVVLTAFMSGLSLGSFILGRLADRRGNMLKMYGILEAGIALSAVATPVLLRGITSIYISVYDESTPLWILSGVRYLLSAAVLLIPTTLMGGTLPVLSRYFIRSESELEGRVGVLYSINTVGGVLGTFVVGFLFIRFFGISLTIHATALINGLIAIISYYLGTKLRSTERFLSGPKDNLPVKTPGYGFALMAFFLSGLSALVYEVAWSRLLVNVIGSTTYAFSLILMGFLLGIGIGSFLASRISFRQRLDMFHFSAIQITIGLVCFSTIMFFNVMPHLMLKGLKLTGQSYGGVLVVEFLLVILYIIVPTTLFGATFPIIAGVYSGGASRRGTNIGNIYAANTAGCILGSAVAAFLLLPFFGSTFSIKGAAAVNLMVGLAGFAILGKRRLAVAAAALLVLPFLPVGISQKLLNSGVAIYGMGNDFKLDSKAPFLLFFREGLNANIAVTAEFDGTSTVRTNGKSDASTTTYDMSTQLALGYFPLFLHNRPEKVLVIGLGSGVTLKAVSDLSEVKEIDVVEIEPAVREAAQFFSRVNHGVLQNPRVNIIVDDARNHIIASKDTYDVIISEPSNPWISGIGNLFSREFYQTSLDRLRKGGIFCQWVQLYGLRWDDIRMIFRTFNSVFPESQVWLSSGGDIILIGSGNPFEEFNYKAVEGRIKGKAVWDLKAYLNISDPLDFFSLLITDRHGMDALTEGARLNTDDMPLLEFSAPYSLYLNTDTVLRSSIKINAQMRLPRVGEFNQMEDITAELLYRKTRNYQKLGAQVDVAWIEKALMFQPRNPDFLVQQAVLKARMKENSAEAEPLLRRALGIDPENADAHYKLGRLMFIRQAPGAAEHLYKAASLDDNEFDYVYMAASARLQEGRTDEALEYLMKASRLPHPVIMNQHIYHNIALCVQAKGDYRSYQYFLGKSIDANPYRPDRYFEMAESHLLVGRKDLACQHFEKAHMLSGDKMKNAARRMLDRYCRTR